MYEFTPEEIAELEEIARQRDSNQLIVDGSIRGNKLWADVIRANKITTDMITIGQNDAEVDTIVQNDATTE